MFAAIETSNLCKNYLQGEEELKVLKNINFKVEKEEFVGVVGPSGSGKSTLLHMLGCVDSPTSGTVLLEGEDVSKLDDKKLSAIRRDKIGFVFQSYNLVSVLSAKENITLPLKLAGRKIDENYLNSIIKQLSLSDRLNHYPNQLSGGQQQRVAIARALASKPQIILADEPTGNLDSKSSEEVLTLLKNVIKKYKQTLIMITHNPDIAAMADRIVRIDDGILSSTSEKNSAERV